MIKRETIWDKNRRAANAAYERIVAERKAAPHLFELWKGVCENPHDDGPRAPLADCLLECDNEVFQRQGEWIRHEREDGIQNNGNRNNHPFGRGLRGRKKHDVSWVSELESCSKQRVDMFVCKDLPFDFRFGQLEWAIPWLRVTGLFPVTKLYVEDRVFECFDNNVRPIESRQWFWRRQEDCHRGTKWYPYPYSLTHIKSALPNEIYMLLWSARQDSPMASIGGASHCLSDALVNYARLTNGLSLLGPTPLYDAMHAKKKAKETQPTTGGLFD